MPIYELFYCPLRKKKIAFCIRGYLGAEPIPCEYYINDKCTFNSKSTEKQ